MNKGTRVKLTQDVTDAQGLTFNAGQVGTVKGTTRAGVVIVDFDGYEAERSDMKLLRETFKHAPAVDPWVGHIPADALESLPLPPAVLDEAHLAKIESRLAAARDEVNALSNGKRWRMSKPAKDDDSDLCIYAALEDAEKLMVEVRRLREALATIADVDDAALHGAPAVVFAMRGVARRSLERGE